MATETLEIIMTTSPFVDRTTVSQQSGDTYGIKVSPVSVNGSFTNARVGSNAKNGEEMAAFLRFDLPGGPLARNSNITKWKLDLYGIEPYDPPNIVLRCGLVQKDGIWDEPEIGFGHGMHLETPPGYQLQTQYPYGTADGSDTPLAALLFSQFLGTDDSLGTRMATAGAVSWINRHNTMGEGYSGLDFTMTGTLVTMQAWFVTNSQPRIALTIDPYAVDDTAGPSYLEFASHDQGQVDRYPRLHITYERELDKIQYLGADLTPAIETVGQEARPAIATVGARAAPAVNHVGASAGSAIAYVGAEVRPAIRIVGAGIEEC